MSKLAVLKHICQQNGVALVYLFGSQAQTGARLLSGEQVAPPDPLTDIDVGVVFTDEPPLGVARARLYSSLYNELEDLFIPYRLDLSFLEENHSVFQAQALAGICAYAQDGQTKDDYEMRILRRAADFRYVLEKYYQERLEEMGSP